MIRGPGRGLFCRPPHPIYKTYAPAPEPSDGAIPRPRVPLPCLLAILQARKHPPRLVE